MNKIWKDVKDYEGLYKISSSGLVWGLKRKIFHKPHTNRKGYLCIDLYKNGIPKRFPVHSLVSYNFIGPRPKGLQVNHKDGNKVNNHYLNLEYASAKDNIRHAFKNGLINMRGENNHAAKLSQLQVNEIRKRFNKGDILQKDLARIYSVHFGTISMIIKNRSWR